jgi:hypothetical protein
MASGRVHHGPTLPGSVTASVGRVGWLEDWRLATAVLVVAAALGAGWTVLAVRGRRTGRHPRHPVLRRTGLGSLVALVALVGVGAAVNSYAGYAPDLPSLVRQVPSLVGARDSGASTANTSDLAAGSRYGPRVISVTLSDRAERIPAGRTWVYLPPGYDDPANAHRRYPVVYLIHGYPSSSYDWFGAGRAAQTAALLQRQGLIRPMILVAPDASGGTMKDTECLDSSVGGPELESFLTRTVVTAIDTRFRTLTDRADRVLGGLSAGGYCALNLGLRHQSEYGVILGMEPYGNPGQNAVRIMLGGNLVLGWQNSPGFYTRTIPIRHPQKVFLAAAYNDSVTRPIVETLATILARRGVDVSLSLATGYKHTWREGRAELPYALVFASRLVPAAAPATVGLGAEGAGSVRVLAGASGRPGSGRPS